MNIHNFSEIMLAFTLISICLLMRSFFVSGPLLGPIDSVITGSLSRLGQQPTTQPDRQRFYPRKSMSIQFIVYESLEGTWRFSKRKAISKSLYRIVQSVLTDE